MSSAPLNVKRFIFAIVAAKWFVSGLAQAVLLGGVTYFVYRPGSVGSQG